MTRLALALAALFCILSTAAASLSRRNDSPVVGKELTPAVAKALPPALSPSASAAGSKEEYRITDQTEVLLDGQPCKYQDVPSRVAIIKMEVATDKKTVLKVHFRTSK